MYSDLPFANQNMNSSPQNQNMHPTANTLLSYSNLAW